VVLIYTRTTGTTHVELDQADTVAACKPTAGSPGPGRLPAPRPPPAPFSLDLEEVLSDAGGPIDYAYFPSLGGISMVTITEDAR
jgi:hypothetical protein